MTRDRKQKLLIIIALVAGIASLSLGFAAFSTTLNISSSATVTANSDTFSVKFSTSQNSLVVGAVTPSSKTSGITATDGVIDNSTNPTIKNLSSSFTNPGQYVEYTFYARNEGEYTAYLNNINFIGDKTCTGETGTTASLVTSACESINISATIGNTTYTETTLVEGHTLAKGVGEQIKIRLEYLSTGTAVDGAFSIKFPNVALVYSTLDDSTIMPEIDGPSYNENSLNNQIYLMAIGTDENIDFSIPETNPGVYIRKGTENSTNPILYFRGETENNNVIFANHCWFIVRTTETGGTKLLYNGTPNANSECNGQDFYIAETPYNEDDSTVEGVKYIHSDGSDSDIKREVDIWYEQNLLSYALKLEDTVWCNDQTIYFDGYYEDFGEYTTLFMPWYRNEIQHQPSFECPAEFSLTTKATSIENKLKYPIALLTADEVNFAGMGTVYLTEYKSYLKNSYLTTISPDMYSDYASVFNMDSSRNNSGEGVTDALARPAISLASNAEISSGIGTASSPYIIN